MKKIKLILLFGILTLLGIGSSFATNGLFFSVDYQTLDNKNVSFGLSNSTNWLYKYYYNNSFYPLLYAVPSCSYNLTPNPILKFGSPDVSIDLSCGINRNFTYKFTSGTPVDSLDFVHSSTYIHIVGDDSCINTGIALAGTCGSSQTTIIGNSVSYSDLGIIHDSQIDGVDYIKGVSSFSFPSTYSIAFSDSAWSSNELSGNFVFKTLVRNGDSYLSNNLFIMKINNLDFINVSTGFDIVVFAFTGISDSDFDLIYSLYNCPSISTSYIDCSFSRGGFVKNGNGFNTCTKGNNSSSVICLDSALDSNNFFNFIFKPINVVSYGTGQLGRLGNSFNYSTSILTLYEVYSFNPYGNPIEISKSLDLSDSSSVDILGGIDIPGGGGNQSENPFGIFGGDSLFYYCAVNHNTRDSPFCFNPDGTLKSDEELKNCYLKKYANLETGTGSTEFFCIDDRGIIQNIDIQLDGSGSVFVPCESNLCSFSSDFGTLGMIGYSSDFFDNYLNTTGYFFKCPWPYDNNLTIWPKLITLLNGVDILLPINCGIAGFQNGKNFLSFENSGHFIPNGPLLNFEGENWSLLYYFFDVIISIGIVIFVGKIFYLFHK